MSVSYATILEKMVAELKQAQINQADQEAVQQHVAQVKLLCDLILNEKASAERPSEKPSESRVTEKEMQVMVGKQKEEIVKDPFAKEAGKGQRISASEDLEGDSIFDF